MRRIRVFLAGDVYKNAGPSNVNKELKKNMETFSEIKLLSIKSKNLLLKQLEVIYKTIISDIIIYSGTLHVNIASSILTKILKKKNYYIMHGYVAYESKINQLENKNGVWIEERHFLIADKILCVSSQFTKWCKECIPQYADKIECLTNGINWEVLKRNVSEVKCKEEGRIAILGGDRLTKNNLAVCKAVGLLNQKYRLDYSVSLYGRCNKNAEYFEMERMNHVNVVGMIEYEEMLYELSKAKLCVQNSSFEPFGLAVVEALMCGCDIVISKNVGAKDWLPGLEEKYIIQDVDNINEISEKILFAMKHSNCNAVLDSIDYEKSSCKMSARRLTDFILEEFK